MGIVGVAPSNAEGVACGVGEDVVAIVVGSGIVLLLLTFRGTDEALEATTYEDAEGVALPSGPEVEPRDD